MEEITSVYTDLPKSSIEQINKIYSVFGSPPMFRIGEIKFNEVRLLAKIDVDNNFVPTIICIEGHKPTYDDIVHEIWHLFLFASLDYTGYAISGNFEIFLRTKYSSKDFGDLFFKLHSHVQHFFFFKNLIEENFNPFISTDNIGNVDFGVHVNMQPELDVNLILDTLLIFLIKDLDPEREKGRLDIVKSLKRKSFNTANEVYGMLLEFSSTKQEPVLISNILKILFNYEEEIQIEKNERVYILS